VVFNRSSLGEILADLAFLVDEIKPEAVYRALREALTNQERRQEIRKRFESRRHQFSWPRAASAIAGLISKFKRKMT
jgi:glycosyltransferase involved in cell wall biosynthesis